MTNLSVLTAKLAIISLTWPGLLYMFGGRGWVLAFIYCVGFATFWIHFALAGRRPKLLPPPSHTYFTQKNKTHLMCREDLYKETQNIERLLTNAGVLYISEDGSLVLAVVLDGPERGVVNTFELNEKGEYADEGKAFDHIPQMVRKLRKSAAAA